MSTAAYLDAKLKGNTKDLVDEVEREIAAALREEFPLGQLLSLAYFAHFYMVAGLIDLIVDHIVDGYARLPSNLRGITRRDLSISMVRAAFDLLGPSSKVNELLLWMCTKDMNSGYLGLVYMSTFSSDHSRWALQKMEEGFSFNY